jgi:hypothetical protein
MEKLRVLVAENGRLAAGQLIAPPRRRLTGGRVGKR